MAKTKEILMCPAMSHPSTPVVIHNGAVEQVTSFELLGVVITNNQQREEHVTATCANVNQRLHF
jgi:hypothetical protein